MPFAPISSAASDQIVLRAQHFELTDSLRAAAHEKAGRLLSRDAEIRRVHLDLESQQIDGTAGQFIAKGRVDLGGPDLLASVAAGDALQSLDLLVDRLDHQLRRRRSFRKTPPHSSPPLPLFAPCAQAV